MTRKEFLSAMTEIKGWTKRKDTISLHETFHTFCPITAVYKLKKGITVGVGEAWTAAAELGLDGALCNKIIACADNEKNSPDYSKYLRNQLLKAIK